LVEDSERLIAALGQWHEGRGPLFERLASALVRASEQAALPSGGELPAERVLARELEISRSTVVAAYRELRERGVAVTRHGSGTVMRNVVPAAAGASAPAVAALLARADLSAPLVDLSVGAPDFDELVSDLTVSGSALPHQARGHGYVPLGWPDLRDLVAQLLSRRGAPTSPDEVLITNGAQEAISLAVGLVAGDGRRIAVESPGYPSALDAIARAGGQPLAIERDAGGLRVDRLKQLLARTQIHALYIAPSCNNPTGGHTVQHRREQIAALAADHELTVIEDTVLDELRFDGDPGAPIWALQPGRVLAAGSLSKVAWGGLRVGWLRAPRPVILCLARVKGRSTSASGRSTSSRRSPSSTTTPGSASNGARRPMSICTRSSMHLAASYPTGRFPPPTEGGPCGSHHPSAAAPHLRKPRCATVSRSPRAARTAQTERSRNTSEFAMARARPSWR
jgi:DNA-binding transcriptional MocR family regulator